MGDIFSLGFGPFRWVCTSGKKSDLDTTDSIARDVFLDRLNKIGPDGDKERRGNYLDNLRWIEEADKNDMVVGSQARILYSDAEGRKAIAQVRYR